MLNIAYVFAILIIVLLVKLYIESSGITLKEWFISSINPGIRIRNPIPRVNCCKSEALQPYPLYP